MPGDLLAAIRQGKQLRKVDKEAEEKREKEDAAHGHNVAAILQVQCVVSNKVQGIISAEAPARHTRREQHRRRVGIGRQRG